MRNQTENTAYPGNDARARIPSVDRLIGSGEFEHLLVRYGRNAVVSAIRDRLNALRNASADDPNSVNGIDAKAIAADCVNTLHHRFAVRPRTVINATGVIVHTNLGRAPLSRESRGAATLASEYVDLEFDIEDGGRGSRHDHLSDAIRSTTGAEAGIAVNNNAAATMLVLAALASDGREVIVSRSEAVEIGGGFRIPDVLAQSGARLVEVGTTNRTYAKDYADAINANTAAILKVHRSNFVISGFTHDATIEELAHIGSQTGVPVIHDVGSGALLDTSAYGLKREPMVQDSIRDGASIVMFSGDKLLGGPQAGIIAGSVELLNVIKSHPLARAMRIDKLTVAALHATLMTYVRGAAEHEIPVWRMIAAKAEVLRVRAELWRKGVGRGEVAPGYSTIGGGSAPEQLLPTWLYKVHTELSPDQAATELRINGHPWPIIGRIADDALFLDPRTILTEPTFSDQLTDYTDATIIEALKKL